MLPSSGAVSGLHRSLLSTKHMVSILSHKIIYHLGFFQQECDQVHIDDVSSDDNGQDLR